MRRAAILVVALLLGLVIAPLVSDVVSADSWGEYTSTGDWDAGVKGDPGDGNYNVETETDNFKYGTGNLTLANMYGDNFNYADADADTFKWTPWQRGGSAGSADIDTSSNDKLRITTTGAVYEEYGVTLDNLLVNTQDYVIDVTIDVIQLDAVTGGYIRYMLTDGNQGGFLALMERYRNGVGANYIKGRVGGASTTFNTASTSFTFRLNYVGATKTVEWLYDVGGGFVSLHSGVIAPTNNIDIYFDCSVDANLNTVTADFSNFKITTGILSSGAYRTAGNWTSPLITQPTGDVLNNITIDLNNSWAGNCIDSIEILNSTDAIISTDNTDLTTNGTIVRDWSTFDNSFNGTHDNGSFKIKLFLKGPGTDTPILQRLNYTTLNYSIIAWIKFDGQMFDDNNYAMMGTRAITTYNVTPTVTPITRFRSTETVFINGTIALSLTVADVNVTVNIQNANNVSIAEVLNQTWNFTQDITVNITEINNNSVVNWTIDRLGTYHAVLYVYKPGEVNADNDTEYFWISDEPFATLTIVPPGYNVDLYPSFSYEPGKALSISFTDMSVFSFGHPITGYAWDFGDGTPLVFAQNPEHRYSAPGVYTVTLEVTNIAGDSQEVSQEITVRPTPFPLWPYYLICLGTASMIFLGLIYNKKEKLRKAVVVSGILIWGLLMVVVLQYTLFTG